MINGFSDFTSPLPSGSFVPTLPLQSVPAHYSEMIHQSLAHAAHSDTVRHSTTIVATTYKDGAMIAADRQSTAGRSIARRDVEKLRIVDNHAVVGMAGTSALADTLSKLLQMEVEYNEKVENSSLTFAGKANLLGQMIASNYARINQTGLLAIPLLAGYDLDNHIGQLVDIDIAGCVTTESRYASIGSGSPYAMEHCKANWHHDMTKKQAATMLIGAIISAADVDTGTVGPDFVRNIFPRVMLITKDGVSSLPDSVIAPISKTIVDKQGIRLGEPS